MRDLTPYFIRRVEGRQVGITAKLETLMQTDLFCYVARYKKIMGKSFTCRRQQNEKKKQRMAESFYKLFSFV